MSVPPNAVEVPSDEPPDYERANGTPGYLLRVFVGPMPTLVFTVTTSRKVTGPEIKVEKDDKVPFDMDGNATPVSRALIESLGGLKLEEVIRKNNPSLKQRAEKIAKIMKIGKFYREYRSLHPQYPPPLPPPVCQLCDKPIRDMVLHETLHVLDREQEYAAILDGSIAK